MGRLRIRQHASAQHHKPEELYCKDYGSKLLDSSRRGVNIRPQRQMPSNASSDVAVRDVNGIQRQAPDVQAVPTAQDSCKQTLVSMEGHQNVAAISPEVLWALLYEVVIHCQRIGIVVWPSSIGLGQKHAGLIISKLCVR